MSYYKASFLQVLFFGFLCVVNPSKGQIDCACPKAQDGFAIDNNFCEDDSEFQCTERTCDHTKKIKCSAGTGSGGRAGSGQGAYCGCFNKRDNGHTSWYEPEGITELGCFSFPSGGTTTAYYQTPKKENTIRITLNCSSQTAEATPHASFPHQQKSNAEHQ
jgi:hypothetical protein